MTRRSLPRIEALPHKRGHQFILDDKPFLILGGELNNSSFSSAKYMREVEGLLKATNLNTILGSVSWEQIEPEEGKFDFAEFDKCIEWARQAGFKVILLWFGAFKNGMSNYVPHWVKRDPERFPRVHMEDSSRPGTTKVSCTVSLFGRDLLAADAGAFAALLGHIKEIDEAHQTVIMVQVENEPGVFGDSRDRLSAASALFSAPPPEDIVTFLHNTSGDLAPALQSLTYPAHAGESWEATFGVSKRTDELFMAYLYARYHDTVAAAGKAAYNLPFYANVWIVCDNAGSNQADSSGDVPPVSAPTADDLIQVSGGATPGVYPSGGAVHHVISLWRHFAPNLALIAPDIYVDEYDVVCKQYGSDADQPLFIPEQRRGEDGALWSWQAIGSRGAIGVSPFGIDTTPAGENPFANHYALLSKAAPFILQARQDGRWICGFHFDRFNAGQPDPSPPYNATIGQWDLTISRASIFGHPSPGYGMIIHLKDDRFLLIGEGFEVRFESNNTDAVFSGLLKFNEVDVGADGELVKDRLLNGDESSHPKGEVARMPAGQPDYGGFFIAISIPSRTKMAVAEPYFLARGE